MDSKPTQNPCSWQEGWSLAKKLTRMINKAKCMEMARRVRNRNLAVWGGYQIVAQNYLVYHKDVMPCKLYHGLKHPTFYPVSSTRLDN